MSQILQNFVKFQKFQLDNLVDFEKCCKTRIYLQKSVPIQPKTSIILPKFCQKLAATSGPDRTVSTDPRGGAVRGSAVSTWDRSEDSRRCTSMKYTSNRSRTSFRNMRYFRNIKSCCDIKENCLKNKA